MKKYIIMFEDFGGDSGSSVLSLDSSGVSIFSNVDNTPGIGPIQVPRDIEPGLNLKRKKRKKKKQKRFI